MKTLLSILAFLAVGSIALATTPADNAGRSYKRGFGEDKLTYRADFQSLARGCTWFYNWGTAPSGDAYADLTGSPAVAGNMEYVPMAWNGGFDEARLAAWYDKHPEEKYLLGFNEPNFREQSNMTPAEAVEPWHRLEAFASARGLKLVAPALNYSAWAEYSTPEKWMDEFIQKYKEKYGVEPHFDYLALHCYMFSPQAVITFVEDYAKKYDKPVWLTEFCSWDGLNAASYTAEQQMQQTIQKLELLEKSKWVDRYAWFKARNANVFPYYNLVEYPNKVNGLPAGVLTKVGFAYVHMSLCDTTKFYTPGERIPANQFVSQTSLQGIVRSIDPQAIDSTDVYFAGVGSTLTYQVDVPASGDYKLLVRYATGKTTGSIMGRIQVLDEAGNDLTAAYGGKGVSLPNTDSLDTYRGIYIDVKGLRQGRQKLVLKKNNSRAAYISVLKLTTAEDPADADYKEAKGNPFSYGNGSTTGPTTPDKPGDNTSSADDVKIAPAATHPYVFNKNYIYYALFLDETTCKANGLSEKNGNFVWLGENGYNQNGYSWENTFLYGDVTGNNSFGVPNAYRSLQVGDKGWSGFGYYIDGSKGNVDLTGITVADTLHLALKSESKEAFDFYVTDGRGHVAHLVFADTHLDGHEPVGNFARNGQWQNVDVPMKYLQEQYGLNFGRDTDYNGNLLCINAGSKKGTTIDFDAVFFYGPKNARPDADNDVADMKIKDIAAGKVSDFRFSADDKYYSIYLDGETRQANIPADRFVNLGDNGTSQNLYLWENTFTYGKTTGTNSFGVSGDYKSLVIANGGWTGAGYNIAGSSHPVNLTAINNDYALHFAVRTTHDKPIEFVLNDGQRDAQLVFGSEGFDGHAAVGDFPRDGQWHEIIVPMKYLNSRFGTNFTHTANYTGNIFVVRTTPVVGNVIDFDAVFLYGPADSKGLETEKLDNREITVTSAEEQPYTFDATADYYVVYLDEETRNSNLTAGQTIYIGPDGQSRNLYPWEGTFTSLPASGKNSFGVPGAYMSWEVAGKGWSGLGYNLSEGVDLSGMNATYTLHFAVKSTSTETMTFTVNDAKGKSAAIILGSKAGDKHVADFPRDGRWYNVDVPLSWLYKQGLEFRADKAYTGNIFVVSAGGVMGTVIDYDAVFFYGESRTTQGVSTPQVTVRPSFSGVQVYNLNGQLTARGESLSDISLQKGLYIVRSAEGTKKILVR